jgi:hypothetical protein
MLVFGGVAFAVTDGFNFANIDANVTVEESMTVQVYGTGIAYLDDGWGDLDDGYLLVTMPNAKPGEFVNVPVRIYNSGYETISARLEAVPSDAEHILITSDWLGDGVTGGLEVPGRQYGEDTNVTEAIVTVEVTGDVPVGAYTIAFNFYRY